MGVISIRGRSAQLGNLPNTMRPQLDTGAADAWGQSGRAIGNGLADLGRGLSDLSNEIEARNRVMASDEIMLRYGKKINELLQRPKEQYGTLVSDGEKSFEDISNEVLKDAPVSSWHAGRIKERLEDYRRSQLLRLDVKAKEDEFQFNKSIGESHVRDMEQVWSDGANTIGSSASLVDAWWGYTWVAKMDEGERKAYLTGKLNDFKMSEAGRVIDRMDDQELTKFDEAVKSGDGNAVFNLMKQGDNLDIIGSKLDELGMKGKFDADQLKLVGAAVAKRKDEILKAQKTEVQGAYQEGLKTALMLPDKNGQYVRDGAVVDANTRIGELNAAMSKVRGLQGKYKDNVAAFGEAAKDFNDLRKAKMDIMEGELTAQLLAVANEQRTAALQQGTTGARMWQVPASVAEAQALTVKGQKDGRATSDIPFKAIAGRFALDEDGAQAYTAAAAVANRLLAQSREAGAKSLTDGLKLALYQMRTGAGTAMERSQARKNYYARIEQGLAGEYLDGEEAVKWKKEGNVVDDENLVRASKRWFRRFGVLDSDLNPKTGLPTTERWNDAVDNPKDPQNFYRFQSRDVNGNEQTRQIRALNLFEFYNEYYNRLKNMKPEEYASDAQVDALIDSMAGNVWGEDFWHVLQDAAEQADIQQTAVDRLQNVQQQQAAMREGMPDDWSGAFTEAQQAARAEKAKTEKAAEKAAPPEPEKTLGQRWAEKNSGGANW